MSENNESNDQNPIPDNKQSDLNENTRLINKEDIKDEINDEKINENDIAISEGDQVAITDSNKETEAYNLKENIEEASNNEGRGEDHNSKTKIESAEVSNIEKEDEVLVEQKNEDINDQSNIWPAGLVLDTWVLYSDRQRSSLQLT